MVGHRQLRIPVLYYHFYPLVVYPINAPSGQDALNLGHVGLAGATPAWCATAAATPAAWPMWLMGNMRMGCASCVAEMPPGHQQVIGLSGRAAVRDSIPGGGEIMWLVPLPAGLWMSMS